MKTPVGSYAQIYLRGLFISCSLQGVEFRKAKSGQRKQTNTGLFLVWTGFILTKEVKAWLETVKLIKVPFCRVISFVDRFCVVLHAMGCRCVTGYIYRYSKLPEAGMKTLLAVRGLCV